MSSKIMIVDDDPDIRDMYTATLVSQGYEVTCQSDGEKALSAVTQEKPDLILLDIMMPKIHGLNVLDIIKATPEIENTRVIMLTALSDDKTKEQAEMIGCCDYIVKSETTMPDVLKRIDKAICRS